MNTPIRHTDYLIIGQGIAGTLFAHHLDKHGHDFIVIDPDCHNASKTAAGMYNPVVLKRFSAVWQGKAQIDTAKATIAELSEQLNVVLDYPMPIWRVFHDDAEKTTWAKKRLENHLSDSLSEQFLDSPYPQIVAPFGLGQVNFGGKIDLKTLLTAYRENLLASGRLLSATVDYNQLTFTADHVVYGNIHANKVVCCEGYGIKQNPYFNHLPLKGNKGEVLLVKIPNLHLNAAIKSAVFIMPMPELGQDIYFIGATYNWTDKDDRPTASARESLLEKLAQFVQADVQVIAHHAGIRPTVIDRRPLLGRHHNVDNLYLLNGLGTRGVMLGATMTTWLYDFIENHHALPADVDIARFR